MFGNVTGVLGDQRVIKSAVGREDHQMILQRHIFCHVNGVAVVLDFLEAVFIQVIFALGITNVIAFSLLLSRILKEDGMAGHIPFDVAKHQS